MVAFLKASASTLLMAPTLASGLATTFEKWNFESGTMFPHWQLTSTGPYSDRAWADDQQEPDFAVTNLLCATGPEGSPGACTDGTALCSNWRDRSDPKAAAGECCGIRNPTFATHQSAPDCSPKEGGYFISSAVPWKDRNGNHGPLRVRSDPFVLGAGEISFWMFGGIDCAQPVLRPACCALPAAPCLLRPACCALLRPAAPCCDLVCSGEMRERGERALTTLELGSSRGVGGCLLHARARRGAARCCVLALL